MPPTQRGRRPCIPAPRRDSRSRGCRTSPYSPEGRASWLFRGVIYPPALSPDATATDRFIWVLDYLRIAIAERHRELGGPTTTAVWTWVGNYRKRFMSLAARVLAGEVARLRPFRPAASRPPRPAPSETKIRLPTKRSWMCVMVPCNAAATGGASGSYADGRMRS